MADPYRFGVSATEGGWRYCLPEPPSANRWWRNVNGRMVTSKEARAYKAVVAQFGGRRMIAEGPVSLYVIWWRAAKRGDLDKRLGVVLDALQGVAYANDNQVVHIDARRLDCPAKRARIVVMVESLTPRTGEEAV